MTAAIEEFELIDYREDQFFRKHFEDERLLFVNQFPIEKIPTLSLREYLIGKTGFNTENSFCRRMRYDLNGLASLGNVRYDIFGIYYNSNGSIALSKTFRNLFGSDTVSAFEYIKKEIFSVLKAAENDDYSRIISSKLNSSFRYKLITVYYPDKFIPVVTNGVLNEYCYRVGLSIDPKDPMLFRNLTLKEWKDHNAEISSWENSKLMRFCDWLWRSNRYLNQEAAHADLR